MQKKIKLLIIFGIVFLAFRATGQLVNSDLYHEAYRPQVHFSPKEKWMNDPNGMVYYKGTYHLFFQFYPNGTTWGPMHWGHAISKDLMHWKQLPIALYPDSLGYIFSGSAVVDENNTSGFGKDGQAPLVAIFTHHDPKGEKAGTDNFQNESIAYSLDEGKSWVKYSGNPVVKNPGIRDFRDPSVMWYAPQNKWIMTLATKDRVTFYSSPNLTEWTRESDFGSNLGAHTGVWECPNLFSLALNGKTYWVLIVSINPGGPNGGSATQYFIGDFDGKTFTTLDNTKTRWVDYGPDDYAGVTWSNTGKRKIFLGWMTNWTYAGQVPTEKWRSAMTIPRELSLKAQNGEISLCSVPVKELKSIEQKPVNISAESINGKDIFSLAGGPQSQFTLKYTLNNLTSYSIALKNDQGDQLIIGFDKGKNQYFIDRTKAGNTLFNNEFPKYLSAPRLSSNSSSSAELVIDASSVELFADGGLTVMTATFFPIKPYQHLYLKTDSGSKFSKITILPLKSIW